MFFKLKVKVVVSLIFCFALLGGGAYAMYVFLKADEVAAESKEIRDAKVSYADAVIASFNKEDKFTFYTGALQFTSKLKSTKSDSAIGDFFVGKETTIYVIGELEAGIRGNQIKVNENPDALVLTVKKEDIFRTFKADKTKSGIKSESGIFALDYDAETISRFWGEIEEAGATNEITENDWKNIITSIQSGLQNFTTKLMVEGSKKEVIVQVLD